MPLSLTRLSPGVVMAIVATTANIAAAQDFARPQWVAFMMPAAVDHVVELAVEDPFANGVTTAVIYRSGSRQREDVTRKGGATESRYADLATGFSWQIGGSDDARTLSFSPGRSQDAYLITRTSQTDHVLGETCKVWRLQRQGLEHDVRWREEDCLTHDGIVLWQKVFDVSGALMRSAHATSIKRRPVTASEVRVPATALTLASYGDWTTAKSRVNDEVLMEPATGEPATGESSLTRRLGALSMTEEIASSLRYRTYVNGAYTISLVYREGSLIRLDVEPSGPALPKTPFQPVKTQSLLGETCQWFERRPSGGDGGLSECITSGGLVLARNRESIGGMSSVVATSKSVGKLTYSDVAPPMDLLVSGWKRPAVSSPMTAKSPRMTPRQVTVRWADLPSPEVQLQNYPARARMEGVEGLVTLNCRLTSTGRPQSCDVVSESPKGYGFADASLTLFKAYAKAAPGGYQAGDMAQARLRWVLP